MSGTFVGCLVGTRRRGALLTLIVLTVGVWAVGAKPVAAQIYPCSPSIPGCLDDVPFFYVVASPDTPQPGVQEAMCGIEIAGCLGALLTGAGLTGREPGDVITGELRRQIVDYPIASPSGAFTYTFITRG